MLEKLKIEMNTAYTENGAVSNATTGSDCLDLFATVGGLRHADDCEIITRFMRAFAEDGDCAMKILFYARDVRGGLGERRVFRVILEWLSENHTESVVKNIPYIAEFGRFDDLLTLLGTPAEGAALEYIKTAFHKDLADLDSGDGVSLLGKWLPSVNASCGETVRLAKRIAKYMGMSDAVYRKHLSALRKKIAIIENSLREKDYTFDYSAQPSKAMLKYRRAFIRNDTERYADYLRRVNKGEAKMNTGTLAPYEIVRPLLDMSHLRYISHEYMSNEEKLALDTAWNSLEDFTGGENALAVIDGSGSMYFSSNPAPITVAMSLGIYFAERNTGHFKNHFITFSESPRLVEIKGDDIAEKVEYCASFNEVANTNVQKVFEVILDTAVKHRIPQEEMPERLYFISDMEFDRCTEDASLTNFEYAKRIFEDAGYTLPEVIFWNVASRTGQQPVTKNEQGAALVSGCTPRLFSMISAGVTDPMAFMLDVISSERYAVIAA